jgi:hypothetical protein
MDNIKIYVVQQGALSYSNVDEVNYVFLDESAAREKHAALAAEPEVSCDSDDRVWTHLYAVRPGVAVCDGELLAK